MEKTRRITDQIQELIMKIVKYSLLVVGMALFVYALSENFSFLIVKSYNTQGSHLTWQ